MTSPPLDKTARTALVGAGVLFFLAGIGWAIYGEDLFLAGLMAALAACF